MAKKIVMGLLGLSLAAFAEFNRSSVLIDIPTAYVLRHKVIQGTAVGSFALEEAETVPSYDFDFAAGVGIGNFLELSVSAYTLENYALGFTALVIREKDYRPSIALGVHEITWTPYIGSFGGGNQLPPGNNNPEDRIIEKPGFEYWEQQEWFSVFGVASKQFGDYFRVHLGMGRGRYTGYGKISQYFNTDIFDTSSVSDAAFGLFGALEFNYQDWFSLAAEFDGRDLNFGTKIGFEYWEFYLALARLENLADVGSTYPFRISTGLNLYASPYRKSGRGAVIWGKVKNSQGESAEDVTVSAFADEYSQQTSTNERGEYRFRAVPEGRLTVVASSKGFRSKPLKLNVRQNDRQKAQELVLADVSQGGTIQGRVIDADDGSGVVANVYVVETGDAVRAGPKGGYYQIAGLQPDKYTLRCEAEGYFDREVTCKVDATAVTELDITMSEHWLIFYFKPGEKMIEARYIPVLEDVFRFMEKRPEMVVEIQGHTDSVGDAKENRELSRKRAQAVRDYLAKRGISPKRLVVKGYGELAPIGDNRTILGRDMNRRVELKVLSE